MGDGEDMSHQHHGNHSHFDPALALDEGFWDDRYRTSEALWSGNPNPQLVTEITGLKPGTALDVGCGEGADAIWLADQGWQVTGLDVSAVAVERAAGHAGSRQITWLRADFMTWDPQTTYDLVSAHFIHAQKADRPIIHQKLAGAVSPGGSLLIVAHHPADLDTTMGRPDLPDFLFTAEEIADALDPADWEIVTSEARPRPVLDPEGRTIHDAILRARRRQV
jgi:SAM-dependent methyltransferase